MITSQGFGLIAEVIAAALPIAALTGFAVLLRAREGQRIKLNHGVQDKTSLSRSAMLIQYGFDFAAQQQ